MLNWYYRNMIYLLFSLPHFSITIFISSQTNRAEGQVQNKSSLSLTRSSLSTASHFFFTRSGGQWVSDYISSSFLFSFSFLSRSPDLICVRDLGLEDRQTHVRFSKPGGLTVVWKVHRKTNISDFITLKNCFDERFTVNLVGLYSPVRV